MTLTVYVAYGYDFGGPDDFLVEPQEPTWFDERSGDDYVSQAEELITEQLGVNLREYGLEFVFNGHCDYAGHLLIVSESERTAYWDTLELDPAVIDKPRPEWDAKLNEVMRILGLTPSQPRPAWFAFASYG